MDITPEDVGLNSEMKEKVTRFVVIECVQELEVLAYLFSFLEKLPGNEKGVPIEQLLKFAKGFACAVLYKYISGRNPAENSIQKLYNLPEGQNDAS